MRQRVGDKEQGEIGETESEREREREGGRENE